MDENRPYSENAPDRPPRRKRIVRPVRLVRPPTQVQEKRAEEWPALKAQSRRRAMDWSLALISQDIESIIQFNEADRAWIVRVPPDRLEESKKLIERYQEENRYWAWREQRDAWPVQLHWGTLPWLVAMLMFYLSSGANPAMIQVGTMTESVFASGQLWRLITATTLHADTAHLATNLTIGLFLISLAMNRYGAGWTMLCGFLGGAIGNCLSWTFHAGPYIGLGSSGVIMTALGMLASSSLAWTLRATGMRRRRYSGWIAGILLFVLLGLSPESDIIAHAGGFLSGMAFGMLLTFLGVRWILSWKANAVAGFLTAALVMGSWVLAATG